MSTITVRLFHHPSRTPIAEIQGVDPGATLSSLRALAERHLAAEEACLMRVFARWHIEVQLGARKAVVELTAQDEAASLSSLGIEDYSAVLLEGPLTGDFEGVGQAVALVAAQVREQKEQNEETKDTLSAVKGLLQQLVAGLSEIVAMQRLYGQISSLPNIEYISRLAVATVESRAFDLLSLQKAAVAGFLVVAGEEAKVRGELLATAISEYQLLLPRFAIDTATLRPDVHLEGPYTAVKTVIDASVTLRASQPLSPANHRWAVRIHEVGSPLYTKLGLLPKLPAEMEAKMGSSHIDGLGGWCIRQQSGDSYVSGDWQCTSLPLAKGSLVLFDYSFTDNTLTIRCRDRQVVGHIPKAGEELYPAISLFRTGSKMSFERYSARHI